MRLAMKEQYEDFIKKTFDSYKCKSYSDEYRTIPMYDDSYNLVAFLKPVTYLYEQLMANYILYICKWRMENSIGFANVFTNTPEKTKNWIDKVLLPRPDRILFMIHDLNDKPIGHIGLSNFYYTFRRCEIDNVVRGVKDYRRGRMTIAKKTIIQWAIKRLEVSSICLKVLSDNSHAIKFYENIGFVKQYNIPLYRRERDDIVEWIEIDGFEKIGIPDRWYISMYYKK